MKTTIPQPFLLLERSGNAARKTHRRLQANGQQFSERASQLADIAATGSEDAAECAAADLFREFAPLP
jgi:hypothetical protein